MINSVRFLKLCCSVVAFVAALAIAQTAHAQDAVVASSTIKGRVANAATGQFLQNAVVMIEGTKIKTTTESDGSYRFSNLPAGIYTVAVSFTGLDSEKHAVEVAAGEEKAMDFDLTSEVYVLGSFTVAAEREGSAKAIQEQRESSSIKNVVASDSFGNMVDGNIGELMKNLPGITIDYADGEDAAKMRYRGMDPNTMSVTMNGNSMGNNAASTNREFSLNDLAVQNIEAIEVNFAPTPDQPSGTMGGAINFKTKSAFNQKGRRVRLDGNLSLNSTALEFQKSAGGARTPDRKLKPGFNLSYTEAFGKEHPFGIALNAGVAQRFRLNNAYNFGFAYDANELTLANKKLNPDIYAAVGSFNMSERAQANERRFISLNLDFKLSESTSLYVYTSYTHDRGLGSYLHNLTFTAGDTDRASNDYDTINSTAGGKVGATTQVANGNTKSWSINPGVKHRFGDFEVSYDAYMSRSVSKPTPEENYKVTYGINGLAFHIDDVASAAKPNITQTNVNATGSNSYLTLNNYKNLVLLQDLVTGTDTQYGAKIDAKKPFNVFGMPLIVQVGGRATESERQVNRIYKERFMTGGVAGWDTAAEPKLGPFEDTYFGNWWQFDAPIAAWVSPYKIYDYSVTNPDKFWVNNYLNLTDLNTTQQSAYVREKEGDRYTRERIYAGYGMVTLQPFTSLTVVAGARYELTELKGKGWELDSSDRPFRIGQKYDRYTVGSPYYGISDMEAVQLILHRLKRTKVYDKVFPNLQLKYEPIKDFFVRAAYTTNMGRPNLDAIMPGDRKYDHQNLIRRKNTDLVPQEGEDYNVRFEYYLPKSGNVGITFFHQKIEKYIYTDYSAEVIIDPLTGIGAGWTVETMGNAGSATNDGFEASYRQRLGFIAKWLEEFEFYTAFSVANPKATYMVKQGERVYKDDQTVEEAEIYNNSPVLATVLPMPNVIDRSASVRLNYNGKKFTAGVAFLWHGEYPRNVNPDNQELQMQAADLRVDLNATYKLSSRWKAYFDWRNVTGEPDYNRNVFGRTNGYYTSGMVMNLGVRADL